MEGVKGRHNAADDTMRLRLMSDSRRDDDRVNRQGNTRHVLDSIIILSAALWMKIVT